LPTQSATAILVIPASSLAVKHCLRKRQPLRFVGAWILKLELGGAHGSHGPESLIVVAEITGAVCWLVVVVGSNLEEQGLLCFVIVCRVASVIPVVQKGTEHGAGFPPVVRRRQQAGNLTREIAHVGSHHLACDGARSGLDRIITPEI
jgi:hypothetical protein